VLDHVLLPETVEEMSELPQVAMVMVRQETMNDGFCVYFVLSGRGNFNTVAGGKNHSFTDTRAMHQIGYSLSQPRFRDVHPLPDFHRRRAMIDAQ
jgi:hypothetical protein